MKKFAIIFSIALISVTAIVLNYALASISTGDLVKMDGLDVVYLIKSDGSRNYAYFGYNNANYWDAVVDSNNLNLNEVKIIPQSELDEISLGTYLTIAAGKNYLLKKENEERYFIPTSGNKISEVNKANYGSYTIITIPQSYFSLYEVAYLQPTPDFMITKVVVEKKSANDNESIYITIKNIGDNYISSNGKLLKIKVQDEDVIQNVYYEEQAIGYLGANKEITIKMLPELIKHPSVMYNLRTYIDYENSIVEADEGNNSQGNTLFVDPSPKPDLIIESAIIKKSYFNGFKTLDYVVSTRICNSGADVKIDPNIMHLSGLPISYAINGKVLDMADFLNVTFTNNKCLDTILPLSDYESYFNITRGKVYSIKITVDQFSGNNDIKESNENNNVYTKNITIERDLLKCIDTDGGEIYGTKGIINDVYVDSCYDDINLKEYYCKNNEIKDINYSCSYGCKNGACLPAPAESERNCTDSDSGYNPNKLGTIRGVFGEDFMVNMDHCYSDFLLYEYSCKNNKIYVETAVCENGCKLGACQGVSKNTPDFYIKNVYYAKDYAVDSNYKVKAAIVVEVCNAGGEFIVNNNTVIREEKNGNFGLVGMKYIINQDTIYSGSFGSVKFKKNECKKDFIETNILDENKINTLEVIFDYDNAINEFNESNNTYVKKINTIYNYPNKNYRYSKFICYDGTTQDNKDDSSCKPSELWKKYGEDFCKNKCKDGKCGMNTFQVENECGQDSGITKINDNSNKLFNNKFDEILSELKELKNLVKEQANKIKYLEKLLDKTQTLTTAMQNALNNFITYGVDSNTQKLGEGERAAVINSYKSAFNKLPETEAELADAIKIANGRWPSITNDAAEKKAKEQFQKIYKRIPDMNNANDNAAVTVMAYGLRQKAENRNLNSEKAGIKTFKGIYGHTPRTTEEWNIMQAITYSGSSRGVDSDGDLLTDEREAQLGTDPRKKDSDGDGYLDGVEVANGYNPLGEGKL